MSYIHGFCHILVLILYRALTSSWPRFTQFWRIGGGICVSGMQVIAARPILFSTCVSGMTIGFSWKKIMQVDEEHLKDVLVDLRENYTNVGCLKLFLYCHYFLNDTYRIYSNWGIRCQDQILRGVLIFKNQRTNTHWCRTWIQLRLWANKSRTLHILSHFGNPSFHMRYW